MSNLKKDNEKHVTFSVGGFLDVIRFYPPLHPDLAAQAQSLERESFAIHSIHRSISIDIGESDIKPNFPKFSVHHAENNLLERYEVFVDVSEGTHFYGGGEQASGICLNGRKFLTWNLDAYRYGPENTNLYQSAPYVLALRPDGTAFGIIADTTFPVLFDVQETRVVIQSKSSTPVPFSVVIVEQPSPQGVVSTLAELTGYMALPPKWSIGYHQCRWSYYPDTKALEVAREFRNRNIPCDVIWFDIHYMDGYRIFTFDKNTFPDPKKLNDQLHEMGFHTVWMIDPGIKQNDPNYFVYKEAMNLDVCVKTKDNQVFIGHVWAGPSVFPDFTNPAASAWWSNLYPSFMSQGIDGVWNDMNEPAVFNTNTKTMPTTNLHTGRGGGTHERFHNVYGMCMVEASLEGIKKANPHLRPFLLSRSNFLGGQRYAATWTGDNKSDWTHLALSIPMILNLGLSGQPFSGPDIGGFFDNANADLFARWIGFGSLLPFARGHTHERTNPHEPYSFGEKTEKTSRAALNRRYKLLLFFYTLFRRASINGLPVVCPLFFVDPKDQNLRKEDRAFMIGKDILVIVDVYNNTTTTTTESNTKPICIPKNVIWYNLDIDDGEGTPDLPQLKLRGGSIVPVIPPQQYVGQNSTNQITLYIGLDVNGKASGQLYDDRGDGYEYKNGEYILFTFTAQLNSGSDILFNLKKEGNGVPGTPYSSEGGGITLHLKVLPDVCDFIVSVGTQEDLSISIPLKQ